MKQEFIKKWSSWWCLRKNHEELTWAFERELDDVIEEEIKKRKCSCDKTENSNQDKRKNPIDDILGKWPGNETDEEFERMMKDLD
jgi:hypothetical protein